MVKEKTRGACGLFRSASTDGAHWLLVVLPDGGWAITRDGEPIAGDTGDGASVDAGVRKFLCLTLARVGVGLRPRHATRVARSG